MKLLAVCVVSALALVACNKHESAATSPSASASAHVHPPIAEAQPDFEAQAAAIARSHPSAAPAEPAVPAVKWNASCQANRECKTAPLPLSACEGPRPKFTWSDVQHDGATMLGKEVSVMGNLGMTPNKAPKPGKCAPGECCHALSFTLVVDGSPSALLLDGLTCTGDDSKLCCTVPADGQEVIAKGRLKNAPKGSAAKYQLADAKLCLAPPPVEVMKPPAAPMGHGI